MSTGRHAFKHNDCARLIRAVEAAGKKVRGVTLTGKSVTVLIDDEAMTKTAANPWDEVLSDDPDQKRPA